MPQPKHYETPSQARRLDKLAARAKSNLSKGLSPRAGFTTAETKALELRYSGFVSRLDEDGFITGGDHVVTCLDTPRPYLHLMSSNHDEQFGMFGAFWDQTGQGFSCLDSVLAGPVTSHKDRSYVPTAPKAEDFRAFYLRESKSAGPDIWFMNPQIGRDEDKYSHFECVQGLGSATIEAGRNDIDSTFRTFVLADEPCEIWTITLRNRSRRARKIQLFVKLTWDLTVHPSYYFDPRSTSAGDVLAGQNAIIAKQNYKRNTLPRTGVMMSDVAFDGFDLSAEQFGGNGHNRYWPRAVAEGKCANSLGLQPYLGLIGALQFDLRIPAGGQKTVNVLVGSTHLDRRKYTADVRRLRRKFFRPGQVEAALAEVARGYAQMHSMACSDCGDEEIDRTYNLWLKYQAKNTARWIRALDQVGYRDILQDLLGICNFAPGLVRNHLPTVLNYQLRDGRAIRQFFKLPDTHAPNDERMYSDSPLWIADTLTAYVEETGDVSILDEQVGFYDLAAHRRDNSHKAGVYEHCKLGITGAFASRGQKGLCLVGYGDWNDAMDGLSRKGKGVSAWLSMCLVFAAQRFVQLARFIGDTGTVKEMDHIVRTMTRNINRGAWDGDHYVFGFNDAGRAVGTQGDAEGRVHCAVNAWSLLTGVAEAAGRAEQVLKVMKRLESPLGTQSLDIAYTQKSRDLVGRIADKAPGLSENGSLYTHGHAFFVFGLITMGQGDEAVAQLKKMMPNNTFPDISTGPPHQQSNFTASKFHADYGKNYFNNFTGSCPWYLKCFDHIFGVLGDFDGVRISPTAPKAWKTYRYRKVHRGVTYMVNFTNSSGQAVVSKVTANGKEVAPATGQYKLLTGNYRKGSTVKVEVTM